MRKRIVKKQPDMKLEIGVKMSHTRDDDDLTSCNLWIAKDRSFPLFLSGETESVFILTAHLKGFTRDNVGMKINEDGTRVTIDWKKPVWEIVMRESAVHKEAKMVGFAKAFRIPDGVVLDRIEASFTEHDSTLTISMPKLVRGIRGLNTIEQVEVVNEGQEPEPTQYLADSKILDDIKTAQEQDIKEEPIVGPVPQTKTIGSEAPESVEPRQAANNNIAAREPGVVDVQKQEPTLARRLEEIETVENVEANLAENESESEAATTQNQADAGEAKGKKNGFSKVTGFSAILVTCFAIVLHLTRTRKR